MRSDTRREALEQAFTHGEGEEGCCSTSGFKGATAETRGAVLIYTSYTFDY